jgi:uncharacterized protein
MPVKTVKLGVNGMHCTGCEATIERAVSVLPGIQAVSASYPDARVSITFDDLQIDENAVSAAISAAGYTVSKTPASKSSLPGWLIFAALLIIVGSIVFWGRSQMPGVMQQLNAQMSYGLLFVIGILTGFHCIGMCGSFVVNYARSAETRAQAIRSHVAYGSGKTLSYVMIGAGFGLLGALITITPQMRGIAALLAGVFLLLFGLKMLNVWPALRRLNIRLPAAFTREVASEIHQRKHPFVIGLLNGLLLGCGPLQAMYIMAAGTGDPVQGGILLFFFGLGTLPPLLGYGFFANVLSARAVSEMVRVSGILVIAMGIMMAQRGIGFLSM